MKMSDVKSWMVQIFSLQQNKGLVFKYETLGDVWVNKVVASSVWYDKTYYAKKQII